MPRRVVRSCQRPRDGAEEAERDREPVEGAIGPGDHLDVLGPGERALSEAALAGGGDADDGRDRLGAELGEGGEPGPVVDRKVVSPGVQLDREVQAGIGLNQRCEQVGHGQDPRADRPRLPAEAPRGEGEHGVLDVGRQDVRRQPLGGGDRLVEPQHEVAGVERHHRHVTAQPFEQVAKLVHSQVGVRLQRDPDARLAEQGRQALQDVERRVQLLVPPDVGPKPVVTIADEGAGVAASQRGDGLDVRRQVARMLPGPDRPVLHLRTTDGVGRRQADFEIEPHLVGLAAEVFQDLGVELGVDQFGVEVLHSVEPPLDGEVEQRLGREPAVADRLGVEADLHGHRRPPRALRSRPSSRASTPYDARNGPMIPYNDRIAASRPQDVDARIALRRGTARPRLDPEIQ